MVDILPRTEWQDPALPVNGPQDASAGGSWVVHYPGSSSRWFPTTEAQVRQYLRNIQVDYETNRGYDIGYSFGVAQSGSARQIRGFDQRPASNPGKKLNEGNFNYRSRSIFVMVGNGDPATPDAVQSINEIIAMRPTWDVRCHVDVDYTACCGPGIIGQVRAQVIGQGKAGTVPPPVQPPADKWADLLATGYNPPSYWWWFPIDLNKPTTRRGDDGIYVRYAQEVIFYFGGGDIVVDGDFGPQTERRVQEVQQFFGLTNDGVIGRQTWTEAIDFMVTLNTAPPPAGPPPVSDVVQLDDIRYYVERGDSPWKVGELAYGSGQLGAARIDTAGFRMFSTPAHPHHIVTPGVRGVRTEVQSGEGPIAVLKRIGATRSDLDTFYAWNGGDDRTLHPGDVVYMPT